MGRCRRHIEWGGDSRSKDCRPEFQLLYVDQDPWTQSSAMKRFPVSSKGPLFSRSSLNVRPSHFLSFFRCGLFKIAESGEPCLPILRHEYRHDASDFST